MSSAPKQNSHATSTGSDSPQKLRRTLSLTQLVLYGLGTTVGAGIYALIGEIAGVAGYWSPWAFLLASILAGFTAYSFAQLSARYPQAAGAALYVQHGLSSIALARMVGLLVIIAGTVSAAALLNGFVGYLHEFVAADRRLIIVVGALILCGIAGWGIAESVWLAGLISIIEVAGLVWIIALSTSVIDPAAIDLRLFVPDASFSAITLVISGAVLSFYAYIGFEDLVEVAEEVKDVQRTLPRAIVITLALSTIIYMALVTSALLAVGPERLASSDAPLAEVYHIITGSEPTAISAIGMFAIINGALIQIIMAARVLYGLADRGQLPSWLAQVHATRRTPIRATVLASAITLVVALSGTLAFLAELTAVAMLTVFALVNLSLFRLAPSEAFMRRGFALVGAVVCASFALRSLISWTSWTLA